MGRRPSSIDRLAKDDCGEARVAYDRAEYDLAINLAERLGATVETHLLRSNALRRLNRHEDAVDAAQAAASLAGNENERAMAGAALAGALSRLGAVDDADRTLAMIGRRRDKWSSETRSDVGFARVLTAYTAGDMRRAEEEMIEAYADPGPVSRARARQMHAYIFGARGQYAEQGALLASALQTLQSPNAVDVGALMAELTEAREERDEWEQHAVRNAARANETLDQLRNAIAARDREIAELRTRLGAIVAREPALNHGESKQQREGFWQCRRCYAMIPTDTSHTCYRSATVI